MVWVILRHLLLFFYFVLGVCVETRSMHSHSKERMEGNALFNDTLNTFYFTVKWRNIMVWVI